MEDILNTPLGGRNLRDEIIWRRDKKGILSVKNVYRFAMELSRDNEASTSNQSKKTSLWKSLWMMKAIHKAKTCARNILNDIILNKENIKTKEIDINSNCAMCGKKIRNSEPSHVGMQIL